MCRVSGCFIIIATRGDGFSMMIDFSLLILSKGIEICVEKNLKDIITQKLVLLLQIVTSTKGISWENMSQTSIIFT